MKVAEYSAQAMFSVFSVLIADTSLRTAGTHQNNGDRHDDQNHRADNADLDSRKTCAADVSYVHLRMNRWERVLS